MSRELLLCIVVPLGLSACATNTDPTVDNKRLANNNAVVWKTDMVVHNGDHQQILSDFPERNTRAIQYFKPAKDGGRPSFGVAFSGGGTRSASATVGQLRALNEMRWLDQAQYVAAVSGGSWTTIPYIYYPGQDDRAFLGKSIPPAALTDDFILKYQNGEMVNSIRDARVWWRTFIATLSGRDESYARVIGRIFLKDFGLDDNTKFFTWNEGTLQDILERNKSHLVTKGEKDEMDCGKFFFDEDRREWLQEMRADDFLLAHPERPFPLIGGSIRSKEGAAKGTAYLPLEMTPLYVGTRSVINVTENWRVDQKKDSESCSPRTPGIYYGGLFIEPHGYDAISITRNQELDKNQVQAQISRKDEFVRHRFNLRDVIGISGAAPLQKASDSSHSFLGDIGFPEMRSLWRDGDGRIGIRPIETYHGDGGFVDNFGLMMLLSRKVENIIVFINTAIPFDGPPPEKACAAFESSGVVDDLYYYFYPREHTPSCKPVATPTMPTNVFAEEKFPELVEAFRKKKDSGEPLVYCGEYGVKPMAEFGIKEAYTARICWAYLDLPRKWITEVNKSSISKDVVEDLAQGSGRFPKFPNYPTFMANDHLIDMNTGMVNALAELSTWSVYYTAREMADHFNKSIIQGGYRPLGTDFIPKGYEVQR